MKKMSHSNEKVRSMSGYVDQLMDATAKAANSEVLQRLKASKDAMVRQQRFKRAERICYKMMLKLEKMKQARKEEAVGK